MTSKAHRTLNGSVARGIHQVFNTPGLKLVPHATQFMALLGSLRSFVGSVGEFEWLGSVVVESDALISLSASSEQLTPIYSPIPR